MPAIVWKGFVSFGLVTFPVRLFSAGRASMCGSTCFIAKTSPGSRKFGTAPKDKPIERSDIVKGYEASKDEYVVVEEEELKKIAPHTATTMEIIQFVREDEVDPIYSKVPITLDQKKPPEGPISSSFRLLCRPNIMPLQS